MPIAVADEVEEAEVEENRMVTQGYRNAVVDGMNSDSSDSEDCGDIMEDLQADGTDDSDLDTIFS